MSNHNLVNIPFSKESSKVYSNSRDLYKISTLVAIYPFVPNANFLYPLKKCFQIFSGAREKAHWGKIG